MASDGSLKFDTSVDTKGFQSGISKLGSIASTGLKAVTGALAAVGAGMMTAAVSGVKYNAQMEQYITSFKTMLGSVDEAQKMVDDLKSFAAETPLEMEGLAKNAQTLMAFGVATENIMPTLKMLGDVALGDQQRMESLSLAFGQVAAAGKLTGQDLLQMVNAGFNPLKEIAQITGKSMDDLRVDMANGAISAEMVAAAFEHATSEGGQFYNAMKAQSKTLSGQLSTLKDNVKSLIGEITEGLTDSIQNVALPTLNEYVSEIRSAFLDNGLAGVADAFGDVMADAITKITRFLPQFVKTGTQVVRSLLNGIKENAADLAGGAVEVVSELIMGIADMLPEIVDTGAKLAVELINGLAEALPDLIPAVLTGLVDTITATIANLPGLLEAGGQLVAGLIEGAVQAIPDLISSLGIAFGTALESIADIVGGFIDDQATRISQVSPEASEKIREVANAFSGFNSTLVDNLEKTREVLDAHEELMKQIEASADAYKDSTSEIKTNTTILKNQKNELFKLVGQEERTAGEKERIKSLVEQLNSALPELNMLYDENANALNRTAESVEEYVEAAMKRQEVIALEEREIETFKQSEAAMADLNALIEQRNALVEGWKENLWAPGAEMIKYWELCNAIAEAEITAAEASNANAAAKDALKPAFEEMAVSAQAASEATTELSTSMEVFEQKVEPVIIAGQDVSAALAAVGGDAQEAQARFEELSSAATDAFERMSEGTEISLAKMTANLEYNAERLAEYSDLVDTIMERFGTEIPEGFREWLQQLGPEQANVLRQLAAATPGEFQAFIDAWERGVMNAGEAAVTEQGVQGNALGNAVNQTVDEVTRIVETTTAPQSAARNLVRETASEAKTAVATAGFDSVGVNMVSGMIRGINSMAGSLASAARSLARQAINAMKDELDINSPSRVFEWMGEMMPAGLVKGVKKGEPLVDDVMTDLSWTAASFQLPSLGGMSNQDNSQHFGDINLYITTNGDAETIGNDVFYAFTQELRLRGVTV